jgi:hypothetical protein
VPTAASLAATLVLLFAVAEGQGGAWRRHQARVIIRNSIDNNF